MPGASVIETVPRDRLTDRLPALSARLERQRAFRLEQLAELAAAADTTGGANPGNQALRAVTALVAAAASSALNDIEIALLRMDIGTYGRCQNCHADIPIRLLEAIPQARLCLACQHVDTRRDFRHGEPVR